MLTAHEKALLDEILAWKDVDEAIMHLIQNYAKGSVYNARSLLGAIPGIADEAMKQMNKKAAQHRLASFWLICQRGMKPDNTGTYLSSMIPVCMAHFPNGNAEGRCEAEKAYFADFLERLRDKKQFSWDKDRAWADMHGYTDYIRKVEMEANK